MDWQFELGRFTSSPKGGAWNHTYGCSQVSYNWTGVSEPSRLTRASSGGGQVLQSTGHVTTEHSMYEFQISVCYWPNLSTWPKMKLTLKGILHDPGFAKAWSTQFAINPLQSLVAQPWVWHVSHCSDKSILGEGLFWSEATGYHSRDIMATAGHIASPVRKQRKMNMNTAAQPPFFSLVCPGP